MPWIRLLVTCFWLSSVIGGLGLLMQHQLTPGEPTIVRQDWPGGESIPLHPTRPTLVVFLHPECPCGVNTVRNLHAVSRSSSIPLTAVVLHADPGTTPIGRQVSGLPGVVIHADPNGILARRFHARTSGHVYLYGSYGRRLFDGGITAGRGHDGRNPGLDALLTAATSETTSLSFPVFGCSLFDPGEGP